MEIVKEVELKQRGGLGGFGAADTSDDLANMNYAEQLVLNKEFLDALATLKVATLEGNTIKGGSILLSKKDILAVRENEEIEMNGVAHKINQVFVAIEVPFYATSYSTDAAEKSVRTKTRGNHKGDLYKVTTPDRLRIYRKAEKFDINHYAAEKSDRVVKDGVNPYNEPTEGMRLREAKWISENGEDLYDTLVKIGVDV